MRPTTDPLWSGAFAIVAYALVVAAILAVSVLLGRLNDRVDGWLLRAPRRLDELIIRQSTFIFGTRYSRTVVRWLLFSFWAAASVSFVALGPPWLVITGLVIGFAVTFSVIRHWLWDEEEKEAGVSVLRTDLEVGVRNRTANPKHINVDVDLRFQTLAAAGVLISLAAMGFSRLDQALGVLSKPRTDPLLMLVRAGIYVWGEVPESVPVVDATGVFGRANPTGVTYTDIRLEWATFWLRATYEVLLVATIFRVASVSRRIAEHADLRGIERLLTSPVLPRQSEAIAHLERLALRGQENAQSRLIRFLEEPGAIATPEEREVRSDAAQAVIAVAKARGGLTPLFAAAKAYEAMVEVLDRDEAPLQWAAMQNNLAATWGDIGDVLGGNQGQRYHEQACDALQRALPRLNHPDLSEMRAQLLNNLGNNLRALGKRQTGAKALEALKSSAEAFKEAFALEEGAETPSVSVSTATNLSITYLDIAERSEGAEQVVFLELAISGFELVRAFRANAADREALAKAEMNLGMALARLGEMHERGAAIGGLSEGIAAFERAQNLISKERQPALWATNMKNQARARSSLGELLDDSQGLDVLRKSVRQFGEVLDIRRESRDPIDWAAAQVGLGDAQLALGQRLQGPQGLEALHRALAAFAAAMRVYKPETDKIEWASVCERIAEASDSLGNRTEGPTARDYYRRAIDAHSDAAPILKASGSHQAWGRNRYNLAASLRSLGIVEEGEASIRAFALAREAYVSAEESFVAVGDKQKAARARARVTEMDRRLVTSALIQS